MGFMLIIIQCQRGILYRYMFIRKEVKTFQIPLDRVNVNHECKNFSNISNNQTTSCECD